MSLGDVIHMVDGTEEHWISFLQADDGIPESKVVCCNLVELVNVLAGKVNRKYR